MFVFVAAAPAHTPLYAQVHNAEMSVSLATTTHAQRTVPEVPFFSQFTDISSKTWRGKGCGIASLAMVINYYTPDAVSVDSLLRQGIDAGAYKKNAGWIHKGLIGVSKKYGLTGSAYDYSTSSAASALTKIEASLKDGPVIASVHYKFNPKSTIPHLVVINGIDDGYVYYNDPAASGGGKRISVDQFLKAWKKRYIVVRPSIEIAQVRTVAV